MSTPPALTDDALDVRKDVLTVTGLGVGRRGDPLVRDVTFTVAPGERVGLIGESGSGKSLTALALMGLLPDGLAPVGSVHLAGASHELLGAGERALSRLRGHRMSMVFQEPMSALNPVLRVGDQIAEAVRIHRPEADRAVARTRAVDLLDQVRLPDPARTARAYPHQLSGGGRQRVMLAMALANDPAVLICDEPTSALDVTVQAQILDLIADGPLRRDAGLLFISHDLAVVAAVCSRVMVMRAGEIVEDGRVAEVLSRPNHPHTQALIDATRHGGRERRRRHPVRRNSGTETRVLELRHVTRTFPRRRTTLLAKPPQVRALHDVSVQIAPGERFGIVGESGSGKSTLLRLLAGLDRPSGGSVHFAGKDIGHLPEHRLRFVRDDVQVVFQDPAGSLDPRMRVREIVAEPLVARGGGRRSRVRAHSGRVDELLAAVGLPRDAADRYPHQFSGGQRQRISIARALAPSPTVLLADEPVSALDASIRAQVLDLLASLADAYDLTLVLVSHDLHVVRQVCDTVAVLHQGEIVEHGPTLEVYERPAHAYTRALLAAVPTLPG
ncbi:ABC transporter ATP-binding protein [Actinopolymorpha sp. B9G3]|uniref:ABC transporter ATP-binding protein n=1 Tax=Actinopolymorpha sp. B9G3 TaxID=3158970 RepID=UPI0032D99879